MKKLLFLISFLFALLSAQSQDIKFISVNGAVDTFEHNITVKRLYKRFIPDSIPIDTITKPYRWMRKLTRKLSRKQRKDSNIYIFFCPTFTDSITGFLPISGKYGYISIDTAKTSAYWVKTLEKLSNRSQYQWDLIHHPRIIIPWLQDDEGAKYDPDFPVKLLELLSVVKEASDNNESTFIINPSNYNIGLETEEISVLLGGKSRDYAFRYQDYWTEQNQQSSDVNTKYMMALTKKDEPLSDIINVTLYDYFEYSFTFNYSPDNNFAFSIETRDYDDFKAILDYLGHELPPDKKSEFSNMLNDYYNEVAEEKDCDEIDVFWEGVPNFVSEERSEEQLVNDLNIMADCPIDEFGTDEEPGVLNIIDALGKKNPDKLLNELVKFDGDETLYSKLYDGMDDMFGKDYFSSFTMLLCKYWLLSSYSKKDPVDVIPYTSTKTFGFYMDNFDIDSEDGYVENYLDSDDGDKIWDEPFHIFDPIQLASVDQVDNGLKMPFQTIPFFFLKSYSDKNINQNFATGAELTLDVALTFSGIGNVSKLRYLKYLSSLQKLQVFVGLVEITASTTSLMLKYTENCGGTQFCEDLSEYLFWIEVGTMGMDIATEAAIKKAAQKALKSAENASDVDSEIIKELRKIAADEVVDLATRKTNFFKKFDMDLTNLKKYLDNLTEAEQIRFLSDFENMSNTTILNQLNNPDGVLFKGWQNYSSNYPKKMICID